MPRFVLLEHLWEGVHWDFMLEDGDHLRTWSIDALIVSGQDLPARRLPPHRRIYLEYEGEIAGGRGSVRRVDEGIYFPRYWSEALICISLTGSQLVGEAELRLIGELSDGTSSWIFRFGNLD